MSDFDTEAVRADDGAGEVWLRSKLRAACDEIDRLRAALTEAESHLGDPVTAERMMLAHSGFTEGMRPEGGKHHAYKQGHSERCYVCQLLNLVSDLQAERDAALARVADYENDYRHTYEEVCDPSGDEGRMHCACVAPMRRVVKEVVAERDAALREVDSQMQAKIDAQLTLMAVTESLDLRFDQLGDGWLNATPVILERIGVLVDEAERLAGERDAAHAALRKIANRVSNVDTEFGQGMSEAYDDCAAIAAGVLSGGTNEPGGSMSFTETPLFTTTVNIDDLSLVISRDWPTEHHKGCDSRVGGDCDCYMRKWAAKRDALDRLVAERDAALAALRGLIGTAQRCVYASDEQVFQIGRPETYWDRRSDLRVSIGLAAGVLSGGTNEPGGKTT